MANETKQEINWSEILQETVTYIQQISHNSITTPPHKSYFDTISTHHVVAEIQHF